METEQIKSAAERMKDDKKLPSDSELQKAVEQAKTADGTEEAARQAVGDVKVAVPKIVQGDEGRSATASSTSRLHFR
jgi:hypothetical protein